jgi:hypothetical protein
MRQTRARYRARRRAFTALVVLVTSAGGLWGTLAILFALRGPAWLPGTAAALFALAILSCLLVLRRPIRLPAAGCLLAAVLTWWWTLAPFNGRDWEPEYAATPIVQRDGDRVTFENIRNATYRTDGDVEPNYYKATFLLSELDELDLVSSHWGNDAIAHVFVTFGFRSGQHLAISVETRRERGEAYSALGGFFPRYELIYVAGAERDLIGARTDVRRESVYLYPLEATPDEIRRLFLSYVDRIQKLTEAPEFYNTLSNNCD